MRQTSLGRIEDCIDWDLDKVFGKGTLASYKKFIKDYPERVFPYPNAMESLAQLGEKYQIQICSSRDEEERKVFETQYHYPVLPKKAISEVIWHDAILIDDYPPRELFYAFREIHIINRPWNRSVIFPSYGGSTRHWNSIEEASKNLLEDVRI
jgi:hypothetical protein